MSQVSAAEAEAEVARRIGARIRELRLARSLTLVQLATATELSHPFLSQLERGLAQPSLASLRRIALALETSPIELIAAADESAPAGAAIEVQRAGAGEVPEGFASGSARMLAHGDRPFHPMEVRADNVEPGRWFVHAEDEFVYVISGTLRLELGDELHEIVAGDSAYYRGGTRHRWCSADGVPCRILVVKQGPRLHRR